MSFISCGVMPCLPVILTEDWGPDRLQYQPGCADHALQCQDLPEPQDQAYVSGLHVEIFDSQLGQQVWNCVKANNGLNCVNWFLKFSFVVWNCVFVNAKDQHVVSLGGQVRVKWLVAQRNSQLGLTCHEWAFMIVEKHWCHIRYQKNIFNLSRSACTPGQEELDASHSSSRWECMAYFCFFGPIELNQFVAFVSFVSIVSFTAGILSVGMRGHQWGWTMSACSNYCKKQWMVFDRQRNQGLVFVSSLCAHAIVLKQEWSNDSLRRSLQVDGPCEQPQPSAHKHHGYAKRKLIKVNANPSARWSCCRSRWNTVMAADASCLTCCSKLFGRQIIDEAWWDGLS